jgi:hypothetical protein
VAVSDPSFIGERDDRSLTAACDSDVDEFAFLVRDSAFELLLKVGDLGFQHGFA